MYKGERELDNALSFLFAVGKSVGWQDFSGMALRQTKKNLCIFLSDEGPGPKRHSIVFILFLLGL